MTEVATQQGGQPLKYTITHPRKPEVTHEALIKWMVEEHLRLAMPIFKKHGVLEYALFVTPPSLNGIIKQELGKVQPSWEFATDFDCFIEFTIPGMHTIKNVMSDPDSPAAVKDQDDWIVTSKALASIGHCTPYLLKTGEVVNM